MAALVPDPTLPCGLCCGNRPCGDHSDDHDDMGCEQCAAVPLSPVYHAACEQMLSDYMADRAQDGSV